MLPRRPRDTPPHHTTTRVCLRIRQIRRVPRTHHLWRSHTPSACPTTTHCGSRACFKGGGESSLPSPLVPGLALQGWNTVDRASRTCPPTRAAVRYRPAPTPCLP